MNDIRLVRNEFIKVGSKWKLIETDERFVDYDFYLNVIDRNFFKMLGGYERGIRNYTPRGYRVTKQISINPDRDHKVEFNFIF
jgi:hypothetical protein